VLNSIQNPIGVSTYNTRDKLPPEVQANLPTLEQLEMELDAAVQELEAKEDEPGLPS
jgi:hypothetical protein